LEPLRIRDRILVAFTMILSVACFALHFKVTVTDGRSGWLLLGASISSPTTEDAYPVIRSVAKDSLLGINWARASGLRPGDRLIRVGDADLRGVGLVGFYARAAEQAGQDHWVKVAVERNGEVREGEWPLVSVPNPPWWAALPLRIAGLAIVVLVFLRAPNSRPARFFLLMVSFLPVQLLPFLGGPRELTDLNIALLGLAPPLSVFFLARFVQTLPDEPGIERRGDRVAAVAGALALLPILSSMMLGTPFPWFVGARALGGYFVVASILTVGRLFLNYRRATPIGGRRIKWLALGFFCAAACSTLAQAAFLWDPYLYWLPPWGGLAGILVPIGLLISVLRFDLFDIDRLFSRTLAFTIPGVVLLAAGLFGLPRVAELLSQATGIASGPSSAVLATALAVAVIPAQRMLRPGIERVLFAARYAIDTAIERLLADLEGGESAESLALLAGERLDAAFHATSHVVYLRDVESHFVPVFARGVDAAPSFDADGPLGAALRGRREVLAGEAAGHVTADARDPFQRAALEAVGVALLLPFHCGAELAGFIGLGARVSGDVYTPTDRTLLGAVGSKLSSQLAQLADRDALARSQDLQGRLRRYVPGAVAEQVEAGADLEGREQEVTVLFIDVRGYSSYAQGKPVGEVFSAISRYTELVTSVVRDAGGAVVEFNGDGMMAVFGAPTLLADKAARALRAGREIAEQLRRERNSEQSFSVGIGIATGSAYVGSIRAADRSIWTALGETTNLAARLQILARDFDASIVIDEATQRLAGVAATLGFERRAAVAIRGREGAENLYCLPIPSADLRSASPSPGSDTR